jgi:hypothetical protein
MVPVDILQKLTQASSFERGGSGEAGSGEAGSEEAGSVETGSVEAGSVEAGCAVAVESDSIGTSSPAWVGWLAG